MSHSTMTNSTTSPATTEQREVTTEHVTSAISGASTTPTIASWNHTPPAGPRKRIEDAKRQEVYGALAYFLEPRGFKKIPPDEFPIPGFEVGFERNGIVVGCANTPHEVNVFIGMPTFRAEEDDFFRCRIHTIESLNIALTFWYSRFPIRCIDRDTVRDNMVDIVTLVDLAEQKCQQYAAERGHPPRAIFPNAAMPPWRREVRKERRWDAERRYIISQVRKFIAGVGFLVGFFAIPPALDAGFKKLPNDTLVEAHMLFDRVREERERGLPRQVLTDLGTGAVPGGLIGLGLGTAVGGIIAARRRKSFTEFDHGAVEDLVEDPIEP